MAIDPLKYMIPIDTNGNQAIIGDHRLPKVEVRTHALILHRVGEELREQLKWFREFSHQNAEYSFVLLEVTCSPLVNLQIFGT